jgi:hypothetical protein
VVFPLLPRYLQLRVLMMIQVEPLLTTFFCLFNSFHEHLVNFLLGFQCLFF